MKLNEKSMLKISAVVLFLAALMDVGRGVAHTYNVRYSAEYVAGIEPISDSLVLMVAFGISNFLTGFIYLLIIWKAKKLIPYILLLIPLSYLIGIIGMNYQKVMMESAFIGRYMMAVYLTVCLITGLLYFLVAYFSKTKA
ncbi:MAG: hypothetical protein AAFQ94_21695 [Bacteroidota bacterium]